MKSNISNFRKLLRKSFLEGLQREDVDRLRRADDGYGETDFEEDVDRLRRADDGYGETEFEEMFDMEEMSDMQEVSPPSDKAEEFIQKNKADFKKRYGERWKEVLYATAWKKFPPKQKKETLEMPTFVEIVKGCDIEFPIEGEDDDEKKKISPDVAGDSEPAEETYNPSSLGKTYREPFKNSQTGARMGMDKLGQVEKQIQTLTIPGEQKMKLLDTIKQMFEK